MNDSRTPRSAARIAAAERGALTPEDLTLEQLAGAALDPEAGSRIGVAVSGGSDSMATLALLARVHAVEAVTVDHGLRPEAAAEAAFVARFCTARGIPHTTLRWDGPDPSGNLMDQARRARLRLIGDWARGRGIGWIALGHTADDQAETFLMRLAREAGLEGLSGMRPAFVAEGVRWVRPFLGQSRAALRGYLTRRDIGWVEDPSNQNTRFDRVKARQALALLAPLGITADKLTATVDHLAMAEGALGFVLDRLIAAHVREISGDLRIDAEAFDREFDPELRRRLIVAALRWVSGADYAPRADKIARFLHDWRAVPDRTLHGCRISVTKTEIRITREAQAVADLRVPAVAARWDRWRIEGPAEPGLDIAALGAEGLRHCPDWRETGLPRATLLASPGVWQGARLVAAPLGGFENGWKARIEAGTFAASPFRR